MPAIKDPPNWDSQMQAIEEEKNDPEIQTLKRVNKEKDELIKVLKWKIVGFENQKLDFLDNRA